jgi:hypothetical protein
MPLCWSAATYCARRRGSRWAATGLARKSSEKLVLSVLGPRGVRTEEDLGTFDFQGWRMGALLVACRKKMASFWDRRRPGVGETLMKGLGKDSRCRAIWGWRHRLTAGRSRWQRIAGLFDLFVSIYRSHRKQHQLLISQKKKHQPNNWLEASLSFQNNKKNRCISQSTENKYS